MFLLSSWGFSSWLVNIPYIKSNLDLNESTLGLILFGTPIGQIIMNYFAPQVIRNWGLYRVCLGSTFGLAIFMIIPIYATSSFVFFIGLVLNGVNYSLLNISMNTITAVVSEELKYSVISTSHAMWSIGGVLGTFFAGILFSMSIDATVHIVIAALIIIGVALYVKNALRNIPNLEAKKERSKTNFKLTPKLTLLIVIGVLLMIAEGFAFDWSAVFLRDYRNASEAYAAFGFSAFMLAMTTGRLLGDTVMLRYNSKTILTIDGIVAIVGILIAVYTNSFWLGYIGLALLGFGVALNSPVLYSLSMKTPGIKPEVGLATFATFSFVGFLAGPPLIGWFAQQYGLEISMLGVAMALLIGLLLSQRV